MISQLVSTRVELDFGKIVRRYSSLILKEFLISGGIKKKKSNLHRKYCHNVFKI